DPLLDDSGNDYDSDGLTNLEEYENNADPWDTDTDNDKLTDYEEVKLYNTDPSAPDSDGDGFTDYTEIQSGTDPNDPNSNPDIRFRKMVIIIISSSIGVVALILGGFFGFFWYTRPKQKILRYIDNLRQEGKTKISVKHLRNYLDKQLNKGEIKQIIAESTSKGLTLEGNYVILMSPEKLIAREEEIVEKIAQHEQKPLSSEEIANLKKEINQLIDFSQKLEQSELVEKFKDLKNAVNKL
ncbi:MAG: hypothetical protein U9O98_03650, partial [Asgard group archaeon]|nr:hypothetical protein [Asgard group archaeon]